MSKLASVVLITFLVAITPSVSDAVQLQHEWEANPSGLPPRVWIGAWYAILLLLLVTLWRHNE